MRERRSRWVVCVVGFIGIITLGSLWVLPAQAWKFLPQEKLFVYPRIDGVGYLTAGLPQGIGQVVTTKAEKSLLIGEEAIVYLDVGTRQGIQVGDRLVAFHLRRSDIKGYHIVVIDGRLRVTQVAEEESAALVEEAYRAVSLGDRVDRYHPLDPQIQLRPAPGGLQGRIIQSYQGQLVLGQGDVVFLDKGAVNGIEPGQCYQVFQVPMEWTDKLGPYEERKTGLRKGIPGEHLTSVMGEVVVLRVEDETAAALITKSLLPISAGERFRSGCGWETRLAEKAPAPAPTSPAPPVASPEEKAFEAVDVHFAFDSYVLDERARAVLQEKARFLEAHPQIKVLIEGNCDERGTETYNLALGDRRANAAKQYLMGLGIAEARLSTISYGEERPLDAAHNEQAWARNRRDHFVILNP